MLDQELDDDSSCDAGSAGVGGDRAVGLKRGISFDGDTERVLQREHLRERDEAKFGPAEAEIAKPKDTIGVIGVNFGNQPIRIGARNDQANDWRVIVAVGKRVDQKLKMILERQNIALEDLVVGWTHNRLRSLR